MISNDGKHVKCDGAEYCQNAIKHHAWGYIKAEDWFFTRDQRAYCPEHIPEWVEEWRAKKAQAKKDYGQYKNKPKWAKGLSDD